MGNSNGKPVVLTDEVSLNHFRLLRVVGKGAFGKVRIVERKDTGLTFALKYIRKDEIVRSESVRNIIRERRMLQQLNHPFLCNLRYSFQDMEYMYIVVDLMNGGDLRFHIARKTFTEEAVQFWIAELACALRYIHSKGIVHRDVKPDNALLDADGHVHLADFNVASDFTPDRRLTSKSGTLAYLAPEVYEGRGYTSEVDWWSLGATFYECIYNKRPFEGSNQESLKRKILDGRPAYPTTNPPVSKPCLHAISSLLEKDKRRRIGATGFETFTNHMFFRSIDFVALERKEIEPIFKPSADKTNFDATYDLEELLLEEAPLEARQRRQKPREQLKDGATQEEIRHEELHRMIETLFEPFNYTKAAYDKAPLTLDNIGPAVDSGEPIDFASTRYATTNPHIKFDQSASRTRDQDILGRTRDRSGTDYSSARSTPVRTGSSAHSPNGSPPLYLGSELHHTGYAAADFQDEPMVTLATASRHESPGPSRPTSARGNRARRGDRSGTATPEPLFPLDQHNQSSAYASSQHYQQPQQQSQAAYGYDKRRNYHRAGSSTGRAAVMHQDTQDWGDNAVGGGVYQSVRKTSAPPMQDLTPTSTLVGGAVVGGAGGDIDDRQANKPSGMLGFLGRKKGRDRSPRGESREKSGKKGKERERGVLGKEGARVIVGNG